MDTDYYLHNFHVKSGRGLTCSMTTYRRAFGIAWNDDDDLDVDSIASSASCSSGSGTHASGPMSPECSQLTLGKNDEEARRVQRVRSRCEAQKESLSAWWKHALQSHVQQRMWMQLGRKQADVLLAPRFERLYEPEKLGQFDRFFSRTWATPVRRSHAAQHTDGAEDGDGGDLSRRISTATPGVGDSDALEHPTQFKDNVFLGDFIARYGYEPRSETSLRRFSEYHSKFAKVRPETGYIGDLDTAHSKAHDEYVNYVSSAENATEKPQQYRPETIQEFKDCLRDYTLGADDVAGIQKV
jgi:hypothetical protein